MGSTGEQRPASDEIDALDVLAQQAKRYPDKIAVVDDRPGSEVASISYSDFNKRVNVLANGLIRFGITSSDRIAWSGRNSTGVLELVQAARKIGVPTIALNPGLTRPELETLLEASRARLVWVDAEVARLFGSIEQSTKVEAVVTFGGLALRGQLDAEQLAADGDSAEPPRPSRPGQSIMFTSGTTGRPKGILRGSMPPGSSEMRLLDEIWGPESHVYLTSGSLTHGGPMGSAMRALTRGDQIVLQRKFDPTDWLRLVDKYRVSFSYCAPTIIKQVCSLPEDVKSRFDRASIRAIFAGAARWPFSLKLKYRADFPENTLWEIYGSSETASVTVIRPDEHWHKPESCGRPVPGVEVVLINSDGKRVTTPGEQGLLYARSDSMFVGYENDDSALRAASWDEGYVTVGDIAYFDEDGFYFICDRAKDMIVSGGVNIYPAEVEAVVERFPGVSECAVIGVPDENWGERVHAVVVRDHDAVRITADDLVNHCLQFLASYKVPRSISFVEELPHTPVGKIRKYELRKQYWTESNAQV